MSRINKIISYADTHVGAPHATHNNADNIIQDFRNRGDEVLVVALGDIFDIKNTKRNRVEEYIGYRDALHTEMGKYYIFGNHECDKDPNGAYYQIEHGIVWLHYHLPAWCDNEFAIPCKKVINWEKKKKKGLNRFEYWAYRLKHLFKGSGFNWKPTEQKLSKLSVFAKEIQCHTIIFGHTHKLYDEKYDGIRIINAGRGRRVYDIT